MNEAYFWTNLEFRLCHEFAGLSKQRFQYLWCDGFNPTQALRRARRDQIAARDAGRQCVNFTGLVGVYG